MGCSRVAFFLLLFLYMGGAMAFNEEMPLELKPTFLMANIMVGVGLLLWAYELFYPRSKK